MYTNNKFYSVPNTFGNFIEDVFQNGIKAWNNEPRHEDKNGRVPVNIQETDKSFELNVVAPGVKKEDIKINIDKNVLTISYEHKEEMKEQTSKTLRTEFRQRSFKRSFTLNEKIETTGISARYTDGILYVSLPKKETTEQPVQQISVA
jgi:HSP20 family protein